MAGWRNAANWNALMNPVTARLLGSPAFIDIRGVLLWGRKGRMLVDTRHNRWHDVELGESGDVVDFVSRQMHLSRSDAVRWLRKEGFFSTPGARPPQPTR